ncbi:MAG: Flp1 family type IVb pilin [Eubacteriales bacterium]|nr:Flp1 family type IVb pilin [Eubacteriales bacterium]
MVLIGLVVLFKNQVTSMVKSILSKMSSQANQV